MDGNIKNVLQKQEAGENCTTWREAALSLFSAKYY
jgi:hypothetical protein